ncbi:uncharacterized protein LOC120182883 [Hibiscus syriacus]|uniref:uncharacterized protein LOC120182883 n=1 Tax=Hibiscus syriacus TaxID=106335 RepID=UPI0019250CEE|nr:uncharacterized protein LOC120182883 [Hibiscus syriacus]
MGALLDVVGRLKNLLDGTYGSGQQSKALKSPELWRKTIAFPCSHLHNITYKQFHPAKAPGINGLPVSLYRSFWPLIGDDVKTFFLDILHGRTPMDSINKTVLVLIPKVKDRTLIHQFRPIELCTVIYKIVSKVLVNHLKHILLDCVDDTQVAFVSGIIISDNFLVVQELFHYLKHDAHGHSRGVNLTLDVEKAYDKIEWSFLQLMLLHLGFYSDWVFFLMTYARTVSYQGLSSILQFDQNSHRLSGLRTFAQGQRITHLFYADDIFLFLHDSEAEYHKLYEVLHHFELASGRLLILRSSAFILAHTHVLLVVICCVRFWESQLLLILVVTLACHFLSILIGKALLIFFVIDWLRKFVVGLLLYHGGREVFLKFVGQALPTYAMGCYLSPIGLLNELTRVMQNFKNTYANNPTNPLRVGQSMVPNQPVWNESLIRNVFSDSDASLILRCPIAPSSFDLRIWSEHSTGV